MRTGNRFQKRIGKGAHLEFLGAYVCGSLEKIPLWRDFFVLHYFHMIRINTVFFLIASSVLLVVHVLCLKLYLYWLFSWIDIPVHILGGSVVALGVFTAYDLRLPLPQRWLAFVPVFLFVLVVALAWEVFEIETGIKIDTNYVADTLTDIFMGLLGGVVGYFVGNRLYNLR